MQTVIHRADSRGHADYGWLNTHHSFSFARYYHPERMNFGALRVLNDDIVAGGAGFGSHPHDNMEIISIPLSGAMEHKDNTGATSVIRAGDVQIMSAGSGIVHAEYNHSATQPLNFLQIWIQPKKRNIAPRYDQKTFDAADRRNTWQIVVAPDTAQGALRINQDAYISLATLDADAQLSYKPHNTHTGLYAFVVQGAVNVADTLLHTRDSLGVWETDEALFAAAAETELVLIEVPMM